MGHIKISLVDNDFITQAKTILDFDDPQSQIISKFFEQIREELMTGQSARLEIEGLRDNQFSFTIAESL